MPIAIEVDLLRSTNSLSPITVARRTLGEGDFSGSLSEPNAQVDELDGAIAVREAVALFVLQVERFQGIGGVRHV
jgi:hypothetical protein